MEQVMIDPFGGDYFFRQFFGGGFQVPQYRQNGTEEQRIGAGTGFFVSADGYIVTNRHVVADEAAEYTVIAADGTKRIAAVLDRDSVNDIAVLKVQPGEGETFSFVPFGDSDRLRVGETVVAIGYALGEYDNSVSRGIVSGLRRSITAGGGLRVESLFDLVQTDTAINPGNSGGPLLNLKGEAVGVSVAVDQGGQNIGFALPVNEVRRVFESVRDTGRISRPWLGVRYVMIDDQMVEDNRLGVDHGALVIRGERNTDLAVAPGSPADKAGIAENDIILRVGGEEVTANRPLAAALSRFKSGDKVKLAVLRKGAEMEVEVTLEERGD
jgi:serine protease Do